MAESPKQVTLFVFQAVKLPRSRSKVLTVNSKLAKFLISKPYHTLSIHFVGIMFIIYYYINL